MREKDCLSKAQAVFLNNSNQVTTPRSDIQSEYQQLRSLEIESAQLKQDILDQKKLNNTLNQSLTQLKAKVDQQSEVIL
jgi:hypothetical protein